MIYAQTRNLVFKFNTKIQSIVENIMIIMGYSNRDYFLLKEFRGNDELYLTVIEINLPITTIKDELNIQYQKNIMNQVIKEIKNDEKIK